MKTWSILLILVGAINASETSSSDLVTTKSPFSFPHTDFETKLSGKAAQLNESCNHSYLDQLNDQNLSSLVSSVLCSNTEEHGLDLDNLLTYLFKRRNNIYNQIPSDIQESFERKNLGLFNKKYLYKKELNLPSGAKRSLLSSDSKKIITVGNNDTCILSEETQNRLHVLNGSHVSTALSSDNKLLTGTFPSDTAYIYDINTGKYLHTLKHTCGRNYVTSMSFSENGELAIVAFSNGIIEIHNTNTGECLQTLQERDSSHIYKAVLSHDNRLILSALGDGARLWDVETGKCVSTLRHDGWVHNAIFSNDSKLAITISYDKKANIWDISTGKCIQTLDSIFDKFDSADFSNSKQLVITTSRSYAIIWDITTGKPLHILINSIPGVASASFSSDDKLAITASNTSSNHYVQVWDVKSGKCLYTLDAKHLINMASFSPNNDQIIAATAKSTILWKLKKRGKFLQFLAKMCSNPSNTI